MSSKSVLRSQRRRELDARRSKSRVRLGSCLQSWGQLKEELGFSLHSELAQHLLESYFSRICIKCSGNEKRDVTGSLSTTKESLQELILLVHNHGQKCPLPPVLQSNTVRNRAERDLSGHETGRRVVETQGTKDSNYSTEVDICLKYTCDGGHHFSWSPTKRDVDKKEKKSKNERDGSSGDVTPRLKVLRQRGRKQLEVPVTVRQELVTKVTTRRQQRGKSGINLNESEDKNETGPEISGDNKNADVTVTSNAQDIEPQEGNDVADVFQIPGHKSPAEGNEMAVHVPDRVCSENLQSYSERNDEAALLNLTNRGTQRKINTAIKQNANKKAGTLTNNSLKSLKDDMSQIGGRKKRKMTPKVILPCEFEGCDKIFSSRQYLNHHVKYQHLQQRTFSCSHPTCNKSFNFKKHLKEHEKLHSNQRDYICEFCARAFRTSSNLIIHRRIHTGEKPLQCEVCGFTCRQKASLNWHMRKHNAESTYKFPCEICGRRFEKRDNVTAHRSKSHPDHNRPTLETCFSLSSPSDQSPHPSGQNRSPPVASKNL